ncbi:MAG: hypothetical protein QOD71_3064 [Thermoleophilaceae bacterium]|jgi:hypothetical protein|nr:hypothetical protein [Thermoleophilaceae bacterium]
MPTLLTRIQRTPDQRKVVKYDVGRTLGLVIIAVVTLVGAVALWMADKTEAGYALFSLGEAIVAGGLGVAIGEKRGAIGAGAEDGDRLGPGA